MTTQGLLKMIDDLTIIFCHNVIERNRVLRFLYDRGVPLGETTQTYIDGTGLPYQHPDCLYPGKDPDEGYVSAYVSPNVNGRDWIEYAEIADLIENGVEANEDDVAADFLVAFDNVLIIPEVVLPADPFAGFVVDTGERFPHLNGRKVARTIRKVYPKDGTSSLWIIKLHGIRQYQQLYEDEMKCAG